MCSLSLLSELYHIIQEEINDIEQLAFRIANFSILIAHYPFDTWRWDLYLRVLICE